MDRFVIISSRKWTHPVPVPFSFGLEQIRGYSKTGVAANTFFTDLQGTATIVDAANQTNDNAEVKKFTNGFTVPIYDDEGTHIKDLAIQGDDAALGAFQYTDAASTTISTDTDWTATDLRKPVTH